VNAAARWAGRKKCARLRVSELKEKEKRLER
jgi:hypothetical protein